MKKTNILNTVAVASYNFSGEKRVTTIDTRMVELAQSILDQGFVDSFPLETIPLPIDIKPATALTEMQQRFVGDKQVCKLVYKEHTYKVKPNDVQSAIDLWCKVDGKPKAYDRLIITGNRRFTAIQLAMAVLIMAEDNSTLEALKSVPTVHHTKAMSRLELLSHNLRENSLRDIGNSSLDNVSIAKAVWDYAAEKKASKGELLREADLTKILGLRRGTAIKFFSLWRIGQAMPEINILAEIESGKIKPAPIGQQEARKLATELEAVEMYEGDDSELVEAGRQRWGQIVQQTREALENPVKVNAQKIADKGKIKDMGKDLDLPEDIRRLCNSIIGGNDAFITCCNALRMEAREKNKLENVA